MRAAVGVERTQQTMLMDRLGKARAAGMTGCRQVQPRSERPNSADRCADVGLERAFSTQDEIVN